MGTLSKRHLREFGVDVKDRIGGLRSNVGGKLDELQARARSEAGHEGALTQGIERLTSALPSSTWLAFAGVALAGSLAFKAAGRKHTALVVGQWVPTFLILGLYNKIVKVSGSERMAR